MTENEFTRGEMLKKDSRIYVAGGGTLQGTALLRQLSAQGYENLNGMLSPEPDLSDAKDVDEFFRTAKPEFVFLAAGQSGGIQTNQNRPAELMLDNLQVTMHIVDAAHRYGVKKLLYLASSCSYPKHCPQPMDPESLLTGPLEPTSEAYATAKLAGIKLCQAYARQYGVNFICGIPANVFGIEDDFSSEGGHVVSSLIARVHEAKIQNRPFVEIWGTGFPLREFLFTNDLADACIFAMQHYEDTQIPLNLGGGEELSIRDVAEAVRKVVGYAGELRFDTSKPDGMPRKSLDSSKLCELGWKPRKSFEEALALTYEAYLQSKTKKFSGGTSNERTVAGGHVGETGEGQPNVKADVQSEQPIHERFYTSLFRIRRVEEKIAEIYPTDKIKSPVHLSIGQEAVSVGVCEALSQDDIVFGTYRGHAMYLAKGGDLKQMMAELYGKATGCTNGKGGSMHLIDTAAGVMGTSAVVGTTIANAVGYAYALKYQKKNSVVVNFFGDGATEEGVFYESLNFATLKKLPILFVCENNGYAIHTHQTKRQAIPDICRRAEACGIPAELIEGNDILKIYDRVSETVDNFRSGCATGPVFLECQTYRWKEHVGPGEDYHLGFRDSSEARPWIENDQLQKLAVHVPEHRRCEIESEVQTEIQEAIRFAEDSPFPDEAELFTDVFHSRQLSSVSRRAA